MFSRLFRVQLAFPLLDIWATTRYLSWCRGCSRTCTSWSGCMFIFSRKEVTQQKNMKCCMHSILGYFILCKYYFSYWQRSPNWWEISPSDRADYVLFHTVNISRTSLLMLYLLSQYSANKAEAVSCFVVCCCCRHRILENNNIHQISSMTFSGLNSLVLLWVAVSYMLLALL